MSEAKKYNPTEIESKWQSYWQERGTYTTQDSNKEKFYILDMFPYPSGQGLHVGHPKGYIATDIYARAKRMQGYEVLHPMGFDAFGLPAEQYAIKNKLNPRVATEKNVIRYKEQLQTLGLDYDWSREVNTTDPKFYKWTQWCFKQMYKAGLVSESYDPINWCPSCLTGLANEDVENGLCERCGTPVEKKPLRQWSIRITDYADRLLEDLDTLDWEPHIKELQRNWIGKSEGAEIDFQLNFTKNPKDNDNRGPNGEKAVLTVFTTRPDTLYGATYLVLAPEHPWVTLALDDNRDVLENKKEVAEYVKKSIAKTTIERGDNTKEKTGVELGGVLAISPINQEQIPVYVADYVLAGYGTGAIMAVPAHDERDFEFATKFNLPIKEVVRPYVVDHVNAPREDKETIIRENVHAIVRDPKTDRYLILRNAEHSWDTLVIGGIEDGENPIQSALREVREETGYTNLMYIRTLGNPVQAGYFAKHKDQNRVAISTCVYFELVDDAQVPLAEDEGNEILWVDKKDFVPGKMINSELSIWLERLTTEKYIPFFGKGVLINSSTFDGLSSEEAKEKITQAAGGKIKSQYKLRDWVFARQRYWGEPFPIVFDENHNPYVVADSELPVVLPDVENYEPTGTGESPLATIKDWSEVEGVLNTFNEFISLNAVHTEREIKTLKTYNEHIDEYLSSTPQTILGKYREELDKLVNLLKGKSVFEIGSATGRDAKYLKEKGVSIQTSDIINSFRNVCEQEGLPFIHFDPLLDNFDKKYDGIIAISSLLHCEQKNFFIILSKINLALNDNGYLYLRLKDGYGEKEENSKSGYRYFNNHTIEEISSLLNSLGFRVVGTSLFKERDNKINILAQKVFTLKKIKAKRETNTMPQWAGSSWYYLRYIDPHNTENFVDPQKEKKWSPVDFYVGGAEHATRHLIYARFWHKFLYDHGYVSQSEPFKKLQTVGLILAEDGRKMSKRWGNVVNPDDVVKEYGADTLRLYEMFMGPFDGSAVWNTKNITGSRRFLDRVWKLQDRISEDSKIDQLLFNTTIKKVTDDISEFKLNTAISALMILLNSLETTGITKKEYQVLLQLLAPFAPHITEELWTELGNENSIHTSTWPLYDESKLTAETMVISVQINGKLRGTVVVAQGADESSIVRQAQLEEGISKWLQNTTIKKQIYVPGKLINFVI